MLVVYVFFWLLDLITGGLILKIMRCENLPAKWYTQPGWMMGNKHVRSIMCKSTCSSGFYPTEYGYGGWCNRFKFGRPKFCPQQILYNTMVEVLDDSGNPLGAFMKKIVYKFLIPPSYYGLDEDSKKQKIADYLRDRNDYVVKCHEGSSEDQVFVSVLSCEYFNKLKNYAEESDETKRELYKTKYEAHKKSIDDALKVCEYSFCAEYLELEGVNKKSYSFCPKGNKEEVIEKTNSSENEDTTVTQRALWATLFVIILLIIFSGGCYYARDKFFDFTKFLKLKSHKF